MNLLVSISAAKLPISYEAAKQALAICERLDECKDWADKAAALASYAKQGKDDELFKRSTRIRDRAIRRVGELLKEYDGRGGDRSGKSGGDPTSASQREAAEAAGLSKDQQTTAVRVASVPADDFETQVESDDPPTVSALADQGKKPRPILDLGDRDPLDFNRAMHFKQMIQGYVRDLTKWDLADVLPRLVDDDRATVREAIAKIDVIHNSIIGRI